MTFWREFIVIDSSFKSASRQQARYSATWNCFIVLLSYIMLSYGKFFSLLKRMHLVLSSRKWIDILLSANHFQTFANSLFKTFLISVTSFNWEKMLVSSAYRYVWLFGRAFGMSFIYNRNNKSPNKDPWGTPQFMVLPLENALSNKSKKALSDKYETLLLLYLKILCTSFCLIKFCDR